MSSVWAPAGAATPDIMPAPARVTQGAGAFTLSAATPIVAVKDVRGAEYFAELMHDTRGLMLSVVNSSGSDLPEAAAAHRNTTAARSASPPRASSASDAIVFRLDSPHPGVSPESYTLDITPRRIVVSAGDARGLFYGAVTLWQLCTTGQDAAHLTLPAMRIDDTPRLGWRGLMLDSARHFQSPQFVLRFIDWMALHKLNVLHWHLTDDQGWRLEIRRYPRLTRVGAWRVPAGAAAAADIDPATGRPRLYGGFYTQDEVRKIVAHAAERNITIVPEIDMPGHATAAIVAYPELGVRDRTAPAAPPAGAVPGAQPPDPGSGSSESGAAPVAPPPTAVPEEWGVFSNLYNVEDSTFEFLDNVLDEVMKLFPSRYIHVGGDEAAKDQWKASPRVQARMRELHLANEAALQSYFIQRIEKHLTAHGRRLIGWDEILEGGIAANATIMSWRGLDGAIAAAAAGHDTVLSPWPTLYFDNRQGAGPDEPPGRGRVVTLQEVYAFDPMPAGIPPQQRSHILGLQANVWTEHMRTEDRVAYMTFPRAAAVAEVGWSPPEQHDWPDFLRRLPTELARYRMVNLPYSADALHPDSGQRELGPFARHYSQDLRTCTDKLVLSLEDDASLGGVAARPRASTPAARATAPEGIPSPASTASPARAVFLIDLMNPCWILPGVDLSHAPTLHAAVGQVPFNFQIGKDRDAIHLAAPRTKDGELEVHLDRCEGELLDSAPLAPAVGHNAVTQLPSLKLPAKSGRHDLCFRFTQRTLDPMWALDWVQLQE